MSSPRRKKIKKRVLYLEEPITFECLRENIYSCLKGDDLCEASPCPLNRFRFGFHKRVLFQYLKEERFEKAYFYFQDLMPRFNIRCSIKMPLKFRKGGDEDEKIPPGCKLFIVSNDLFKLLNRIIETNPDDSTTSLDDYGLLVTEFKETLFGNVERLERLAIDDRYKTRLKKLTAKAQMLNSSIITGEMKIEGLDINLDEYGDISNKKIEETFEDDDDEEEIDGL
jgi:hypothetical protein